MNNFWISYRWSTNHSTL